MEKVPVSLSRSHRKQSLNYFSLGHLDLLCFEDLSPFIREASSVLIICGGESPEARYTVEVVTRVVDPLCCHAGHWGHIIQ